MPHLIPGFFASVARPFWRTEFAIESGSLRSPASLLAENESLKRELEDDKAAMQSTQAVLDDDAEIKALLGRGSSPAATGTTTPSIPVVGATTVGTPSAIHGRVLAAVLARPPLAPYDELVIDGGVDLGLAVGDKVYAAEDSLIGEVSEVSSQTSKVVLYTTPGQHYEVFIGQAHAPAQAVGRGGGQYSAEIPSIVKVAKGDLVSSPALGDKPFGVVSGITSDPVSAFETVLFAPLVNIYQIRWVTVQKSATK